MIRDFNCLLPSTSLSLASLLLLLLLLLLQLLLYSGLLLVGLLLSLDTLIAPLWATLVHKLPSTASLVGE